MLAKGMEIGLRGAGKDKEPILEAFHFRVYPPLFIDVNPLLGAIAEVDENN
jgi:hypothetical protein